MQIERKREAGKTGEEPGGEESHLNNPRVLHTIPHFRRSHHSEKRSSTKSRKTAGRSHRSLVSRLVTPPSEKGMPAASLLRSAGFQYFPPVWVAMRSSRSRFCSV